MSYQHRIYRPDGTYWVSEFRDDTARTVTTYDETGAVTSTRPYAEDENAAVDAAQADAALLTDLAARVARIEEHLWPAPPDPTTPDDPSITDWEGVWPDGGLLREDGTVWRNISGVPPTVAAWSASARYEVGDRCTRGGRLYECLVAHGAEYAGTWGPPQASVWTDLGPA